MTAKERSVLVWCVIRSLGEKYRGLGAEEELIQAHIQVAQEAMREQAAAIADAHICGCGDHATEVARRIRALPIE